MDHYGAFAQIEIEHAMNDEKDSKVTPGEDEREPSETSRRLEQVGDRLREMRKQRDDAIEETERTGAAFRGRRDEISDATESRSATGPAAPPPAPELGEEAES